MGTEPVLPPDEAPLDPVAVARFLQNMPSDMVLVGGQALAFWMDRYGIEPEGAVVTNDGDVLGRLEHARSLATTLRAVLLQPSPHDRTAIVAQLRLPTADGKAGNIDVLHQLYTVSGLRESAEFTRRVVHDCVEVEWQPGKTIRVMDPLDVLASRAQNAAGLLKKKGPHVLTQLEWAIDVAREALLQLARNNTPGCDRLGQKIQGVFTLARSQAGRKLWREHGIDVLVAIDVDRLLALSPTHAPQLAKVEEALAKRRSASHKSKSRGPR